MPERVAEAVARLAREDGGRVLAVLAHRLGDLDLADDAVQDALVQALETWPRVGVPDNPGGWLTTVARNKALDRLRRRASARRRTLASAPDLVEAGLPPDERGLLPDPDGWQDADERLRLVLLCCHPALAREAQVALTLRLVGGLTVEEIGAGLLVGPATVTQRIVRAKRKIRAAAMPLSLPAQLDERVGVVLDVLYLVFNEGYLPRAGHETAVRTDLADEAVRLARVVADLLPDDAEVEGLLALMLFQSSRFATRVDARGDLVLLEDQDRSRWDGSRIAEANGVLGRALSRMTPGPRQVEALVAAHHANARTAADTDWPAVASLYAQLAAMDDSPVVALNHAVAVAMADGPRAGLVLVDRIAGLEDYHLLHAVRGDLLTRCGDPVAAQDALARARRLARQPAEQRLLDARLAALAASTPSPGRPGVDASMTSGPGEGRSLP